MIVFCIFILSGCQIQHTETSLPSISDTTRAQNIQQALSTLPELQKITVLVDGHTALIGIETTAPQERTTRQEIRKIVNQTDTAIQIISITSNETLIDMIAQAQQKESAMKKDI